MILERYPGGGWRVFLGSGARLRLQLIWLPTGLTWLPLDTEDLLRDDYEATERPEPDAQYELWRASQS